MASKFENMKMDLNPMIQRINYDRCFSLGYLKNNDQKWLLMAINAETWISQLSLQWRGLVEDRNARTARGLDFTFLSKFIASF